MPGSSKICRLDWWLPKVCNVAFFIQHKWKKLTWRNIPVLSFFLYMPTWTCSCLCIYVYIQYMHMHVSRISHTLQAHETPVSLANELHEELHTELHGFVSRAKRVHTRCTNMFSFFQVLTWLHKHVNTCTQSNKFVFTQTQMRLRVKHAVSNACKISHACTYMYVITCI